MIKKYKFKSDWVQYFPIFFTLVFIVILLQYPLFSLESIFYDTKIRLDFLTKPSRDIVVISMDEESDDYLGDTYPYASATLERIKDKLETIHPKVVGLINDQSELSIKLPHYWIQMGKNYPGALIADAINFSRDDVVRRAEIFLNGKESFHLAIANQFVNKKISAQKIYGSYYDVEKNSTIVQFKYFADPAYSNNSYQEIPLYRVLSGGIDLKILQDKIILIGPKYISHRSDFSLSPFNQSDFTSSNLLIHANIIDSIKNGRTIYPIPRFFSDLIAVLIGIFMSVLISKLKPKDGLLITIAFLVLVTIISFLLQNIFGIWIYSAHIVVSIFVVYYIWIPFRAIEEYQRRFAIQEETRLLKNVEKLKQNFLSLMSHDLKTPVAKIAGIADNLMYSAAANTEIKEKASLIVDSTKELNKFISSILDLIKIESENLGPEKSSKDINLVIEQVINELQFTAKLKEIKLEEELGKLYPIQIDVNLMTRVVSNLVENAIKYSPRKATVEIKTWDDLEWVYIEVSDNGPGIPSEEWDNIFEKFYRVKNDANHSIKGSGLGLYLVKYFVELHGGEISVESEVGRGTKFIVKLINK